MTKLNNPKAYTLITSLVLFCVGLFGFAFHGSVNMPDSYLVASLILGFWGLVIAANSRR